MTEDMFSCLKQRDKHKVLANVTLHKLQDYFKDLQLEMQDRYVLKQWAWRSEHNC